jgi:hypothetical protein
MTALPRDSVCDLPGISQRLGMHINLTFMVLVAGSLCAGMLIALELGRRLGQRRLRRDPEGARAGLGTVEGSLFGLLGLLIAFTFGGAAARFDERKDLIVSEANAVSTAWARLDMLPPTAQPALRDLFRRYLDARLEIYQFITDLETARKTTAKANQLQGEIWTAATGACRTEEGRSVTMLVLPALNEMFDITTTRTMAIQKHPPTIIFVMLFALSLGCSMLAGYGMAPGRERSLTHMLGFAVITAMAVYVIIDLEFPRLGVIRVDKADKFLVELRATMN